MRFEAIDITIQDIEKPVEPRTCKSLEYRDALGLCDVNPLNGQRRHPLRVQMEGRLVRGGNEDEDEFCHCKYDLGSPVELY